MTVPAFVLVFLAVVAPTQPSLSLKDVIKRVERYVAGYGEQASIVVCTERYDQTSEGSGMSAGGRRALVSDFAIVYAGAIRGWLGFRDVLEVDGQRVSDREDRLARVLMGSEGRLDEARRVSDESARYNIGAIQRNFNLPTAVLFFFTPENHGRFRFAARRVAADGTWEIAYRETERPTLIREPNTMASIPSSGTIWVDPQTGTIVRTRLQVETIDGHGQGAQRGQGYVDVVYRHVEDLDMWLPASMDERFDVSTGPIFDRVTGHAEYSNYRKFTTSVRIK
jgi:hypothetical protein